MNILTASSLTANMSAEVSRTYQPQQHTTRQSAPKGEKVNAARRFDSVSIEMDRRGSFEMELRGKLKQEVRAATSSGQVAALQAQVREGSYQTDPAAIARKILLIGEAV